MLHGKRKGELEIPNHNLEFGQESKELPSHKVSPDSERHPKASGKIRI